MEAKFKHKADGGDAKAQFKLGKAFEFGEFGLEIDKKIALMWYRKAADGGNASAHFKLGLASDYGELGFEIDKKMALEWYRKWALRTSDQEQQRCLPILRRLLAEPDNE